MFSKKDATKLKIERYRKVKELSHSQKTLLLTIINDILKNSWGEFPRYFIETHVLNSADTILLAKTISDFIGFCAVSTKEILKYKICYIEFLVVKKEYQKKGIGSFLVYSALLPYFIKQFFKNPFKGIETMFISPNIAVIANLAKYASFIYPNPFSVDKNYTIPPADDISWEMANKIIAISDNPNRKLNRNGLVLEGSYVNTPWLIYTDDNIPWYHDDKVNKFARKYLGYGKKEDKEFVVRARINLFSLLKYLGNLSRKKLKR